MPGKQELTSLCSCSMSACTALLVDSSRAMCTNMVGGYGRVALCLPWGGLARKDGGTPMIWEHTPCSRARSALRNCLDFAGGGEALRGPT